MCESYPWYLDLCQAPQRSEVVRGDFGQRRCGGACVTYIYICIFVCMYMNICAYTYAHIHTCTQPRIHACTHARTHTPIRTHTHTHTHTHTNHTFCCSDLFSCSITQVLEKFGKKSDPGAKGVYGLPQDFERQLKYLWEMDMGLIIKTEYIAKNSLPFKDKQ